MFRFGSSSFVLALFSLVACSGGDRQGTCPIGTVPQGNICVTPPDGGPIVDTGVVDTGEPQDSGPGVDVPIIPDTGPGAASISAAEVNFGAVAIGVERTATVVISNDTAAAIEVSVGDLAGPAEFGLTVSTSIGTQTLGVGQSIALDIRFTPNGVAPLNAIVPLELCPGCTFDLVISGSGVRDAVQCAPTTIDFGTVAPGSCRTAPLVCSNAADHDVSIRLWNVQNTNVADFAISDPAAPPLAIGAMQSVTLGVDFCPVELGARSNTLDLILEDSDEAMESINLTGFGGVQDISCTTTVDFGTVPLNTTTEATASCENLGNAPLVISNAAFAAAVAEYDAALEMGGNPVALPLTLAAGESVDIAFEVTPATAGVVTAQYEVTSDDPDEGVTLIALTAEGIDGAGCELAAVPTAFEFADVPVNGAASAAVLIENIGTGFCDVQVVGLSAQTPATFTLLTGPQSLQLNIGQRAALVASYAPTAAGTQTGSLQLTSSSATQPTFAIPLSGTGQAAADLEVSPTVINFGDVIAGCGQAVQGSATLSSGTFQTVSVDAQLTAESDPAFSLLTASPISLFFTAPVDFQFAPTTPGLHGGRIAFEGNARTVYLSMYGNALAPQLTTRTFPGRTNSDVDLLLMVDDSCSMQEEQQALASVASILINRGDLASAQYHIGVTTADPTPGIAGTLRGGFVTWNDVNRQTTLQTNILQGTAGSGIEEGLRTAALAVTDPTLISGTNAGFSRTGATLAVIMMSDEPDQSPGTVNTYVEQMVNRPVGGGIALIYSITGGPAGCSGAGGTADAAPRYIAAAAQTGGSDNSICATDYTPFLTAVADAIYDPLRTTFPLRNAPAGGTVVVRVNNVVVPATGVGGQNWGVDYEVGLVRFTPLAGLVAADDVSVDFMPKCVPPTCGNGQPDPNEGCDDGNNVNTDACPDTCYAAFCGDGFIRSGVETCDDGNNIAGDGCDDACLIE